MNPANAFIPDDLRNHCTIHIVFHCTTMHAVIITKGWIEGQYQLLVRDVVTTTTLKGKTNPLGNATRASVPGSRDSRLQEGLTASSCRLPILFTKLLVLGSMHRGRRLGRLQGFLDVLITYFARRLRGNIFAIQLLNFCYESSDRPAKHDTSVMSCTMPRMGSKLCVSAWCASYPCPNTAVNAFLDMVRRCLNYEGQPLDYASSQLCNDSIFAMSFAWS